MKNDIVVLLTVYKRKHFNKQISAILNQTKKPKDIYVYQNESHVEFKISEKNLSLSKSLGVNIFHLHNKDKNFKFHGRFTIPLVLDSEYICIFDDDTIPGQFWLQNCLDLCSRENVIVGANGRLINNNNWGIGDGSPVDKDTYVDYVGHSWFFKREWIHNMWKYKAFSFENGEDMHFAASCFIEKGVRCVVPKQQRIDRADWGDSMPELGWDDVAQWKKPKHKNQRIEIINYWKQLGWNSVMDSK